MEIATVNHGSHPDVIKDAALANLKKEQARCAKALAQLGASTAWDDKARGWYSEQIAKHFGNLRRLSRSTSTGAKGQRWQVHHLLTSYSGRLCGFLGEFQAKQSSLAKAPTPAELDTFLQKTKVDQRIFSHAQVHVRSKPNGSKRAILAPALPIRAAQRHVSNVCTAPGHQSPFEYARAGRGRDKAILEIIRLIEEEGLTNFVQFDIKNYFTSVKPKHLKGLSIPKKVIQHSVLFNSRTILVATHGNTAEAEAARQGLPQGARLSGNLASSLLGRELCHFDGAKGIVSYVDDVLMGACDPTGANALAKAIKKRFDHLPGGPLSFKMLKTVNIEQGISFLGYYLRRAPGHGCHSVSVRPSHEAYVRLRKGIFRRLRSLGPNLEWDAAAMEAGQYRERWLQSFGLWKPDELELLDFAGRVDTYVDDFLNNVPAKIAPLLKT